MNAARPKTLRVVTHNIHRGMSVLSRRHVQAEVQMLLEALDPDVICLQEVWRRDEIRESDLEQLCDSGWSHRAYGRNAVFPDGSQGNAILSRYTIESTENVDISISGLEPRGILWAHLRVEDTLVAVINAHFGLFRRERRQQLKMLGDLMVRHTPLGPCVVAGDFNDWRKQLTNGFEGLGLKEAHQDIYGRLPRTFPSPLPLFCLDRMYFTGLTPLDAKVVRDRRWLYSSDHLPYVVDFNLPVSGM